LALLVTSVLGFSAVLIANDPLRRTKAVAASAKAIPIKATCARPDSAPRTVRLRFSFTNDASELISPRESTSNRTVFSVDTPSMAARMFLWRFKLFTGFGLHEPYKGASHEAGAHEADRSRSRPDAETERTLYASQAAAGPGSWITGT